MSLPSPRTENVNCIKHKQNTIHWTALVCPFNWLQHLIDFQNEKREESLLVVDYRCVPLPAVATLRAIFFPDTKQMSEKVISYHAWMNTPNENNKQIVNISKSLIGQLQEMETKNHCSECASRTFNDVRVVELENYFGRLLFVRKRTYLFL